MKVGLTNTLDRELQSSGWKVSERSSGVSLIHLNDLNETQQRRCLSSHVARNDSSHSRRQRRHSSDRRWHHFTHHCFHIFNGNRFITSVVILVIVFISCSLFDLLTRGCNLSQRLFRTWIVLRSVVAQVCYELRLLELPLRSGLRLRLLWSRIASIRPQRHGSDNCTI